MIKSFISLGVLCTALGASDEDSDGWVNIAPIVKNTFIDTGSEHENFLAWTLFTKQLGDKTLKVRMPGEPKYQYLTSDELEITSNSEIGLFQVSILHAVSRESIEAKVKEVFLQPGIVLAEVNRTAENRWDISFRKDGKWIAETYLLQENHLIIFHSENAISHRQNHQDFVASLEIKIPQK